MLRPAPATPDGSKVTRMRPGAPSLAIVLVALVLVSGCSCDDAEIRLSVRPTQGSNSYPDIRVQYGAGLFAREIHLSSEHRSVGPVSTRRSGTLEASFSILSADGAPATSGSVELDLREDWRWGVEFVVSSEDPVGSCFGCVGSEAFELDPALGYAPDQRLYVVWGGNSICDPVTY